MQMGDRHAAVAAGGAGFATANESLDLLYFRAIDLAGLLVAQELVDLSLDALDLVWRGAEQACEVEREIDEPAGVGVEDGNVARSLIRDVNLVPLIDEANQRTPHADHVVVGMGREDDHA